MKKLFKQRKPALLLTLGTASAFIIGGGIVWWLIQRKPIVAGLPVGAEILPQEAAVTLSFSTDKKQWQQLRQFGTPETQAALDKNLVQLRDRLLTTNGLNYQRDIQPWVGNEITVAFLPTPGATAKPDAQQVKPYGTKLTGGQSTVMVVPIADPLKAQQLLTQSKTSPGQDWVDRDYKGVRIREVHGKTEQAYAAAVLNNQFLVASTDTQAVEQVIDTSRGKPSVADTPGYGQALNHIAATNPFLQVFVNVPAASELTTNNATQPVPPQSLLPLKNNQGLAANVTLEPGGMRFHAVSWLSPNSKYRYKVINDAERMPSLLPAETLLMTSGGNLKQSWQDYTQQPQNNPRAGIFNPDVVRQGMNNLTGLDLDKDLIPWMSGEFALALVSASKSATSPNPKAGVMLLVQASDRRQAEETFKRLDGVMKDRYRFQVSQAQVAGKPVVNWVSPFNALTITHGWLDGNIAFLAIGPELASTILPAPAKPLAENDLFKEASSAELKPNNGQFFIALDRLANPNVNLPLPNLPTENRAFLNAIRGIGVTAAMQDGRTTRYDIQVLMRKTDRAPGPLPAAAIDASPSPTANSPSLPEASPSPSP